jgi:LysR family transcriptional regulator, glycine cleavage system transcriptional activator
MPRRLPPLNALPSFEAAARHLSFSKAADELHLTHGAVSRAVRHLEDRLGVPLFVRATRAVSLTPIGASYAAEVRDALDHLAAATVAVTGHQSSGMLNISTLDSFAAKWLVPRLFRSGAPTAISTSDYQRRRSLPISSVMGLISPFGMGVADIPASRPNC